MTYTLKKLSLHEGKDSLLGEGYQTTAPMLHIVNHLTGEKKSLESIKDIELDWQVMVSGLRDYHITSPVQRIGVTSDRAIIFDTRTSTYELRNNDA